MASVHRDESATLKRRISELRQQNGVLEERIEAMTRRPAVVVVLWIILGLMMTVPVALAGFIAGLELR